MRTVHEVSKLTGVSIRTLQYYDKIGLLHPAEYTESGYRLYDDADLEKLQQIMLFRELEFPLKEIQRIISSPNFDKNKALEQQITLLELKKERLVNLISFARELQVTGVDSMGNFEAFDTSKQDEYAAQAKASWGNTDAYQEYQKKCSGKTSSEMQAMGDALMDLFAEFGKMKNIIPPSAPEAQAQVQKLQQFITDHYYTCTNEILKGLGMMYAGGGAFTENIDKKGGKGTATFVNDAIQIYCK